MRLTKKQKKALEEVQEKSGGVFIDSLSVMANGKTLQSLVAKGLIKSRRKSFSFDQEGVYTPWRYENDICS